MSFVAKISSRYLWCRKGENFINAVSIFAVVGVALGVAVLNITMSIMTGFEEEVQKKLVGSSHIYVGSVNGKINAWEETLSKIQTVSGVKLAAPYVQGQVMLTANERAQGLLLKGVVLNSPSYQEIQSYEVNQDNIKQIILEQQTAVPSLVLGAQLRHRLAAFQDQKVSVISSKFVSGPFGLAPRQKTFKIAEFYKSGMSAYEESLAYTSISAAQRFFRLGQAVTGFEITVDKPNLAPLVKEKVVSQLQELGHYDFFVQDWTELNSGLWEAISLEKKAYFTVLLLLIVLASFSIVTTLIMIVLEKRKDIAIIRTFGARSKIVRNIFMRMGASIGLFGTVLGLLLGLLGCYLLQTYGFSLPQNVFPTDTLPVKINITNFLIVGLIAWAICILATIYPAFKASRLKPCEILRYE